MGIDSLSPTQRPLDVPGILSEVKGVPSSDILIRNAVLIGLDDLRQNPWQLQLVFNGLLDDPFTKDLYGAKEISKAVNWFLKTNIPVIMDFTMTSSPSMPVIIISLDSSNEAEASLGDVHYVPGQLTEAEFEPLGQKFSAQYNSVTGLVIPSIPVIVNTKMVLVDKTGVKYPIIDSQLDVNGNENLLIQKGLTADFSECVLEWSDKRIRVNLESCNLKETYNITCNAKGEPYYALYLYSIVLYSLMRYKKTLLEGRGFERSVISSTKMMTNNSLGPTGSENIWCRVLTVTGYSRMYWATQTSERITQANYNQGPDGLLVSQKDFLPSSFSKEPNQLDPSYLSGDGIGIKL